MTNRLLSRLLTATLIVSTSVRAATDPNAHGWYMYFGDHPVAASKWGVHLEGQWRRHDVVSKWQQLLLRPGLNYQLTTSFLLTGGYGFIQTYGYGDFPVRAAFPEHRFFEQVQITHRLFRLNWQNRLRFEQRYLGVMEERAGGGFQRASWRYENRFRYMLRTNVPLPFAGQKYYLALYDEIMLNYGKNVAFNVFDQNRAYIALGRTVARETRLEVGFLKQTLQQRSGRVFEHNHTLQVAIYSRLPFGD